MASGSFLTAIASVRTELLQGGGPPKTVFADKSTSESIHGICNRLESVVVGLRRRPGGVTDYKIHLCPGFECSRRPG